MCHLSTTNITAYICIFSNLFLYLFFPQEHCSNNQNSKPNYKKADSLRSRSPLTIPTIITEDVDSDPSLAPCDSPENRQQTSSHSWSPHPKSSSCAHQAVLRSKSVGVSSSEARGASLGDSSSCCKSSSTSTTSVTTMGSTDAHPTHYHTVHGTSHIGHSHHQCSSKSGTTNSSNSTAVTEVPGGTCTSSYCCKQRNRSHSGPAYPIAFPQAMRHSALMAGGLTPTCSAAASTRRRQSDDSEQTSSSLRSRVSPSGSSFFDSFRYVLLFTISYYHSPMTSHFLVILSVLAC